MAVDGPGADGVFHSLQFPPPGDLFGGPSYGKTVSDVLTEAGRALDLRSAQLSRPDPALCAVWPVAIDISVPAQFPMDRSTMAVQTSSDLCHACQGRKASTHIRHPGSQPDLCIGRKRDHGDKARNRRATASGFWLPLNRSRCSLANSNLDLAIDRTRCWLCSLVRRFLDDLDWKKLKSAASLAKAASMAKKAIQKGKAGELRLSVAMAGIGEQMVRIAEKERNCERNMAADLRRRLGDSRDKIERLASDLEDAGKTITDHEAAIAKLERTLADERQHWGHDLTETRAEQKALLGERLGPLLEDAIDALEINPPAPGTALRRVRAALAVIQEAKE